MYMQIWERANEITWKLQDPPFKRNAKAEPDWGLKFLYIWPRHPCVRLDAEIMYSKIG